jgi:hypothetical protein
LYHKGFEALRSAHSSFEIKERGEEAGVRLGQLAVLSFGVAHLRMASSIFRHVLTVATKNVAD